MLCDWVLKRDITPSTSACESSLTFHTQERQDFVNKAITWSRDHLPSPSHGGWSCPPLRGLVAPGSFVVFSVWKDVQLLLLLFLKFAVKGCQLLLNRPVEGRSCRPNAAAPSRSASPVYLIYTDFLMLLIPLLPSAAEVRQACAEWVVYKQTPRLRNHLWLKNQQGSTQSQILNSCEKKSLCASVSQQREVCNFFERR